MTHHDQASGEPIGSKDGIDVVSGLPVLPLEIGRAHV